MSQLLFFLHEFELVLFELHSLLVFHLLPCNTSLLLLDLDTAGDLDLRLGKLKLLLMSDLLSGDGSRELFELEQLLSFAWLVGSSSKLRLHVDFDIHLHFVFPLVGALLCLITFVNLTLFSLVLIRTAISLILITLLA